MLHIEVYEMDSSLPAFHYSCPSVCHLIPSKGWTDDLFFHIALHANTCWCAHAYLYTVFSILCLSFVSTNQEA